MMAEWYFLTPSLTRDTFSTLLHTAYYCSVIIYDVIDFCVHSRLYGDLYLSEVSVEPRIVIICRMLFRQIVTEFQLIFGGVF